MSDVFGTRWQRSGKGGIVPAAVAAVVPARAGGFKTRRCLDGGNRGGAWTVAIVVALGQRRRKDDTRGAAALKGRWRLDGVGA